MKNKAEQTNQASDETSGLAEQATPEAMRFGEEHYRIVTDAASDAIISIDEESRILFANRATEKIFGYTLAELSGNSITMLMPDYLRHLHRAGVERYIETGKRHLAWDAIEVPGLRKSGKEIPLEISFGEFVKDGKHFFTGIMRDVTERKRAERYLAAQHAATRALAESMTLAHAAPKILQTVCEHLGWEIGALWLVDGQADCLRCAEFWRAPSTAATEFESVTEESGLSRGAGLPGRVWESAEPAWIADVTENSNFMRAKAAAAEGLHGGFAFPILLRGEVFGVVEFFSREIQPPDQELLGMMSAVGSQVGQFIEHRQALEEKQDQIRRINEELEQRVIERTAELAAANKELESFSYSVSHDLRSPLRSIDGFSQALLEDYSDKLDAQGQNYLQRVRAASQRMAQLIDDMLNLSRVSRGEMRREQVDLSRIARDVIEQLRSAQPKRVVEVEIEDGIEARGDDRLLRIALENLLGNAWKFTSKQPSSRIEFGARAGDAGEKVFFVRDNGAGFDMAYADKLFGAFQRLHSADEFEGTGVGLATVQRIIRRHGGRIRAESEPGQGATFYFTL